MAITKSGVILFALSVFRAVATEIKIKLLRFALSNWMFLSSEGPAEQIMDGILVKDAFNEFIPILVIIMWKLLEILLQKI